MRLPPTAAAGPELRPVTFASGREAWVADEGARDGAACLFIGGFATSGFALAMTRHTDPLRDALGLRVLTIERPGLGMSPPAPGWTAEDYADEAAELMDRLGIVDVAVLAISGGGVYAGAFAAAHPARLRSLHLSVAVAPHHPDPPGLLGRARGMTAAEREEMARGIVADPAAFWTFPEGSPVDAIPGLRTLAAAEGARAFHLRGPSAGVAGVAGELERFGAPPRVFSSPITAPAFLYEGGRDALVPASHGDAWAEVLADLRARRVWPEVGHEASYPAWERVLLDAAGRDGRGSG